MSYSSIRPSIIIDIPRDCEIDAREVNIDHVPRPINDDTPMHICIGDMAITTTIGRWRSLTAQIESQIAAFPAEQERINAMYSAYRERTAS